ncbi:SRPBCC family protein [Luteolibacter sp. SL250]|uniref:SRPBCC family protein n=1 Tax=Luteolibacter sp. SL250 TaxID=2995170 RepID=UPI00226E4A18|nr:SRPBCC family protein [Luteolibacter sp. SL250]WAC18022.1 SRPBCC family protein [Luteolibacter sp. SL250]
MTKKILAAVALLIAVFVIYVASLPDEFRVSRSTTINAPPSTVFPLVSDLRAFQTWSPWAKMDPQSKVTYEGPASGVGSSFSWQGGKIGEGTMATSEIRQDEFIRFMLIFRKPFSATNTAEFTFKPEGDGTVVTWSMEGRNNFLAKIFSVFMDCEKMIGGPFEQGLADLKTLSEAKP